MPVFDNASNSIIVRIVYAGPPMAGKTESIQSLAQLLLGSRAGDAVFSPGEAANRTLYFDWMDYAGGLFKGRQVRCQIVTVPGQKALTERRQMILRSADAVVFVADSRSDRFDEAQDYLQEVKTYTDKSGDEEPAVGILLQANKRDLPDALSLDAIRSKLSDDAINVVETAAKTGRGIREAFVMSVGLALERAQLLMKSGNSLEDQLDFNRGEDLLAAIEAHEATRYAQPEPQAAQLSSVSRVDQASHTPRLLKILSTGSVPDVNAKLEEVAPANTNIAAVATSDTPDTDSAADEQASLPQVPRLPDASLPAGSVWPPVSGRIILHEISEKRSVPKYQAGGTWTLAAGDNWLLASQANQVFEHADEGRRQLLEHARAYKSLDGFVSENRCVALSEANDTQWRIWQVIRREKTLSDELRQALQEDNPIVIADKLFQIGGFFLHAAAAMRTLPLTITPRLHSCSLMSGKAVYTGFIYIDAVNDTEPEPFTLEAITDLIRDEFSGPITARLEQGTVDVPLILGRFKQLQDAHRDDPVIEAMSALFIGH